MSRLSISSVRLVINADNIIKIRSIRFIQYFQSSWADWFWWVVALLRRLNAPIRRSLTSLSERAAMLAWLPLLLCPSV